MTVANIEDPHGSDLWILSVISMGVGILSILLLFIFPKKLTKLDEISQLEDNNNNEPLIQTKNY